jgi:hypothetical protein
MRDGVVWSKGFYVHIENYGHPAEWSGTFRTEYTLIAGAYSASRLGGRFGGLVDPQLLIHPDYVIDRPSGCTICVAGWTKFTPYADPQDVHRLMQLDLSCLTSWHSCLTQSDIMPVPWAEYLAEHSDVPVSSEKAQCPQYTRALGRDSTDVALVETLRYQDVIDSQGYHTGVAKVRLVDSLKGVADWRIGVVRQISVQEAILGEHLKLSVGSELILFRARGPSSDPWTVSVSPCPITWANQSNLTLVGQGIVEDYLFPDESEQE